MKNKEIKEIIRNANLFQWQIAEGLGICETTFCRKLRKELSSEEKQRIIDIIEKLSNKEAV